MAPKESAKFQKDKCAITMTYRPTLLIPMDSVECYYINILSMYKNVYDRKALKEL